MNDPCAPYYELVSRSDRALVTPETLGVELGLAQDEIRKRSGRLSNLIATMTRSGEVYTRRNFLETEWVAYFTGFDDRMMLRRSPLLALTSVEYITTGAVWTEVDPTSYYLLKHSDYSSVMLGSGKTWPTDIDYDRYQSVRISFTTGYGLIPDSVDQDIREAILRHAISWYDDKGDCDCSIDSAALAMPTQAIDVYERYKIHLTNLYE